MIKRGVTLEILLSHGCILLSQGTGTGTNQVRVLGFSTIDARGYRVIWGKCGESGDDEMIDS
jgi:hypothetical protein